jgi:hypothetical protein
MYVFDVVGSWILEKVEVVVLVKVVMLPECT